MQAKATFNESLRQKWKEREHNGLGVCLASGRPASIPSTLNDSTSPNRSDLWVTIQEHHWVYVPYHQKKIKKYNNQNFQPLSSIIFLYKASLSQRVIQGSGVDSPALKL